MKRPASAALASPAPSSTAPASTVKVLAVIPSRLASTRLPGKVLRPMLGEPLLAWVYRAAAKCPLLDEVVVATDSEQVAELCRGRGWHVEMTSADLTSGTDRVHEVAQRISADIYVNVQGDEPMVRPEHIEALLAPFSDSAVEVATLMTRCPDEEIQNPNCVKVVTDADGRALYFSRAPIPFDREGGAASYWKHLGFYAYRKSALDRFPALPHRALENAERLEQLRFLENRISIAVVETPFDTVGVDTEEDFLRAEEMLRLRRQ